MLPERRDGKRVLFTSGMAGVSKGGMNRQTPVARAVAAAAAAVARKKLGAAGSSSACVSVTAAADVVVTAAADVVVTALTQTPERMELIGI